MFWITGQNRASWRRSSRTRATQRLGPRDERGGGKYSACGTEEDVLTSMFNTSSERRCLVVRAGILPVGATLDRRGILRSPPRSRKCNPEPAQRHLAESA